MLAFGRVNMDGPLSSPRAFPLRWHLMVLVVGTLLPVVLFGAVVAHQLSQSERAAAERRLMQSARDLATTVDREMSSTIRTLSALAASEPLERGDLESFHAEARRVAKTQPSWLTVILLLPDGRQVVNTKRAWGAPLPSATEPASLRRTVETRSPAVGDLARGVDGTLAFPVRVPVLHSGELRYVLTAAIAPQMLAGFVDRQLSPQEEWTRTVVDRQGMVVARSRDPERFVGKPGTPSFIRSLREAREGLRPSTTLDGQPVYTAFSHAAFSGWAAIIAVPRGVVEGPARRTMIAVAGAGLALLLVSGLGAFVLSRHVSQGIASAASAAAVLAHGGRPRVQPSRVAEVARLAEALDQSADLLAQRERERNEHLARAEASRADAESASRAKDEFLAMLGHELRNPLGPIRNGAHLLRQLVPDNERVARVLEIIDRQIAHIVRLVDELLDASRIARGKVVLQKERLDLRLVARNVYEDFTPDFDRVRIAFHLDLPPAEVWVHGDRTRLAQCLGNLLHNALKFTPEGGNVALALTVEGDLALLEVRDDGPGIDPGLLPALFEPFSQGPQPLDRGQGGLGLGLALVKGLTELHGGTVRAHSDGPGKGTVFTVSLPLEPAVEPAAIGAAPRS
ncbi:MAG TPA: sensor histidine kinase [Thermoanaerobaculia bacterium]|nr:sensor histidine kinase [Thermoanaerobaculia bacterium]